MPLKVNQVERLFLLFFFLIATTVAFAQTNPDAIVGDWLTTDKNAIIRCYKQGNQYFGKVIWYAPFIEAEEGHPIDPAENTKYLNALVMKNFVFADNEWSGGRILDLPHNKNYTAFARLNKKNQLEVTGYMFFRWLSQTLTLEKANTNVVENYIRTSNLNR